MEAIEEIIRDVLRISGGGAVGAGGGAGGDCMHGTTDSGGSSKLVEHGRVDVARGTLAQEDRLAQEEEAAEKEKGEGNEPHADYPSGHEGNETHADLTSGHHKSDLKFNQFHKIITNPRFHQ